MALLDIKGWGKNPIVKNVDNTPLDIKGFEAGVDFSSPSDKLQEIETWTKGYLAAAERKYNNISSKDPENLSLRIIKGEISAIKRILQEFAKDKTAL